MTSIPLYPRRRGREEMGMKYATVTASLFQGFCPGGIYWKSSKTKIKRQKSKSESKELSLLWRLVLGHLCVSKTYCPETSRSRPGAWFIGWDYFRKGNAFLPFFCVGEMVMYGMSLSLGFTLVGMIPLVMAGCSGPSNVPIDASVISIF